MCQHADVKLARQYLSKINSSKEREISFELSFAEYKKLRATKRCYYTRLPLGESTFSIDRIDSSKGYVTGNVVACHVAFNAVKGTLENPNSELTLGLFYKGLHKLNERLR